MGRFVAKTMTNGVLTVPPEVMDALGLKPGDAAEFVVAANGSVSVAAKRNSVKAVQDLLAYRGPKVDVDAAIAETVRLRTSPGRQDPDP